MFHKSFIKFISVNSPKVVATTFKATAGSADFATKTHLKIRKVLSNDQQALLVSRTVAASVTSEFSLWGSLQAPPHQSLVGGQTISLKVAGMMYK